MGKFYIWRYNANEYRNYEATEGISINGENLIIKLKDTLM